MAILSDSLTVKGKKERVCGRGNKGSLPKTISLQDPRKFAKPT